MMNLDSSPTESPLAVISNLLAHRISDERNAKMDTEHNDTSKAHSVFCVVVKGKQ